MRKKNILITGGCGFLGQYLVNDILSEFSDAMIKVIDLKANDSAISDYNSNPKVQVFLNKNISDYNSIKDHFKDIDIVIHLAGVISFSLKDKDLLMKVNVEGTKNIIKAIKKNKVKQFIHISSVAALGYNDDKEKPIDEKFRFDWKIAESKKKYYMLSKHLADVEIENNLKSGAIILYPGLMFGPGDVTNSARLIKAIKDRKIPFNMPGGTNIIDVRDVSKGIVSTIKKKITNGPYLLSGHNVSFVDVNKIIADELSVCAPKYKLPKSLSALLFRLLLFIEYVSKNKLELTADNIDSAFKFRYFTNKKAKEDLGWNPKISFQQTIKDTIIWMDKDGMLER